MAGFDYSNYPDYIDGYSQIPLATDNYAHIDATNINRLRSAVINIQKELGTLPSSNYATVKDRLDSIEASLEKISNKIINLEKIINKLSGTDIRPDIPENFNT